MIIVLFHTLYLLGKYVYDNFNTRKEETKSNIPANQLLNVSESDYENLTETQHVINHVKVQFFPPVYIQRYTTIQGIIASDKYYGKIRKVIDFGCAELAFTTHLKNTDGVKEILCIDVDRPLLESSQSKVAPLHCDYLNIRNEPLTIHVCEGSIAHNDKKLENTDAVICIELIEHLYPDDLEAFPYNVFGFIKPLVAIVTTPNADFNVLFEHLNGFRHADHKFEWTREQFQNWANNIILRYPNYEVTFHGIGTGPKGTEHLGSCSQMAVFHRHTQLHEDKPEGVDGLIKTVVSYEYPYRPDNRSDEEKIRQEAEYYIRLYSSRDEELSEEIPLRKLMFSVEKFRISVEILRGILEVNWAIVDRENGPVILIPPQSMFSDNSDVDFDNFLDNDYRHHGNDDDWDTLEPGAPRSGYLFDSYMERDTQDHEEEENWDDEANDTRHSSSSNLNSENPPSFEQHVPENLDCTSDSQWTMEDLNNEDLLSNTVQHQDGITLNSFVAETETELPSNSFLIGLDYTDIDYLNVSNDALNSFEHNLSSPLLRRELSETSQSLRIDSSHSFPMNRNPKSLNDGLEDSTRSEDSNTGTCAENSTNMKSDSPVARSLQHADEENQVQYDSNHLKPDNEKPSIEFQTCFNLPTTENNGTNFALRADVRLSSNDCARLLSNDSPSLCLESAVTEENECRSLHDETSSISTLEATLLLSDEHSLPADNRDPSANPQKILENEEFRDNRKKYSNQSINNVTQHCNTSLTDQPRTKNDESHDLCSMYLEPSASSNNSLYTENENSHSSIRDLTSATNENYKNLDVSGDSIDSSYRKCEADLINKQNMDSMVIKSQDSMSFQSISDCSLDLQPKYTSSPQILTNICKIQTQSDDKTQRFLNKPSLCNHECTSMLRIAPQTVQSLNIRETDFGNGYGTNRKKITGEALENYFSDPKINLLCINEVFRGNITTGDQHTLFEKYSFEGKKVDEKDETLNWPESTIVDNISTSTSQLSLQSNSDISSSTVTSTGSSIVDKWYTAETNPMYQHDVVVLKGGNDTADNPTEETTSDSDATASGSEKGKDRKSTEVIDQRSKTTDRCYKIIKNNQPQNNLNEDMAHNLNHIRPPNQETVTYYSDNLTRGTINDKLPCEFFQQKKHGENSYSQDVTVEDNLSVKESRVDIIANESINIRNEPGTIQQIKSSIFVLACEKMKTILDVEEVLSLDSLNVSLEKETTNLDDGFNCRVEKSSKNVFEDTNDIPIFPNLFSDNSSINQDTRSNISEVTETLAEPTKKICNKVDGPTYELEFTLETTKEMANIKLLAPSETEFCVMDKKMKIFQDVGKNVDNDMNIHEIFPEQVQNSSRPTSFLLAVQKTDDKAHHVSFDCPDRLSDSRPPGFPKQNFPTFDIFGTRISELQSTMSDCKSTPSNEVSTSYNVSRTAKGGSQLRHEFDSARGLENLESKPFSPESLNTPPDSWSPEIMDSGYPNSVSVHDITPEYELSSIANDRISDSDSASLGEVPVPGFYEFVEVENGDLANNNRDDEGNNVIAYQANDMDDLQPLIDVLENDIENENDIYVLQNGFPLWLLRILEMANPLDLEGMQAQLYPAPLEQAGGDAPNVNVDNDEGFDSSSSEDNSDIEDDEADDATTISSDETEDHSADNLTRDWRAGGDP